MSEEAKKSVEPESTADGGERQVKGKISTLQ